MNKDKMNKGKKYPIDTVKGRIDCPNIESRIGDILSDYAYKAGIDFGLMLYESDIQWIENNITKNSENRNRDILWHFEDYFSHPEKKYKSPYILDYMATFFESFIDTDSIPDNVNKLLIVAVGRIRAVYKKLHTMPYQNFFVEAWLRKTRDGR